MGSVRLRSNKPAVRHTEDKMAASKAESQKRRPRKPTRDIESWAHDLLIECYAIRACPDHGHMRDTTDPGALRKAREAARSEPFPGATANKSVAAIDEAMRWIGDTCPGCK
jgi:hypothetical protein